MSRQQEDIPADLSELIRRGSVASVDLAGATCTVRYGNPDDDDGGAETPPIRWLSLRAGKTRTWSPPSVGEGALVLAPDGQIAAAVALVGIYQDGFSALGDTLAELIEYEDGARIAYDPVSHSLTAMLPEGGTALVEATQLIFRGDVTIEGNVSLTGQMTTTGDVTAAGISLRSHTHSDVQPGGGQSGAPR